MLNIHKYTLHYITPHYTTCIHPCMYACMYEYATRCEFQRVKSWPRGKDAQRGDQRVQGVQGVKGGDGEAP